MRQLLLVIFFACVAFVARAEEVLSPADKAAVTAVIDSQLRAFAADQDATAYGYAAPIVKFAFPNAETFMNMVKKGYGPVYRNRGYAFGESLFDPTGRPSQKVMIDGVDGKTYEAIYFMERQPDGTWLIAGCVLILLPGTNV